MSFQPSPQQAEYFKWITDGSGSCILTAVAGSGKTTTLIEGLTLMGRPQKDTHRKQAIADKKFWADQPSIFFGAYNKKIAEEIQAKTSGLNLPGLKVSTMHAAGFGIWRQFARNVKVDENKCRTIYRELYPEQSDLMMAVLQLVSLAKQSGFGACVTATSRTWADTIDHFSVDCGEYSEEVVIQMARAVLAESVRKDAEVIDFDDMIYAPLIHKSRPRAYDWVLIDEAQDTNASRRALALLMLKRGGRLVAVGDPHQAIYGFTGADADSLDLIAKAVSAKYIPLTVSYRCPQAVTALARTFVDHIQSHPGAPQGLVTSLKEHDGILTAAVVGDAILCRFNAPIVTLAYRFIAQGTPAKIEGRDIGTNLKALARKWKVKKADTLIEKLENWQEKETVKLRIREKESLAVAVEDRVKCLMVLINRCLTLDPHCSDIVEAVCGQIDSLFADGTSNQRVVKLMSIHRSKGLEFKRVFWLQAGPSKWARKDWEHDCEANLAYVAITRAQEELYLVPMPPKEG